MPPAAASASPAGEHRLPAGHIPTVDEAMIRLDQLRAHGPTPEAFTFKQRFPPPGTAGDPVNLRPEPYCVL